MAKIHECHELRNRHGVFRDREDAGEFLGKMLAPAYANREDVFLLTIPMGGVPVAREIRRALKCPMDLIIVRKIQIPGDTEAGFGAMTQEGDLFLNEALMATLNLSPDQVEHQSAKVRGELAQRNERLRGRRPFPDLEGKTVILTDDGLASGFTMKASIFMVRKRGAAKVVVAAPTAPRRSLTALDNPVDEFFCPNVQDGMRFAVAAAYQNWRDLETDVVEAMLVAEGVGPG
ncbi:MAG: phosphoribosyltransferase [Desulfococcaceae bacterium]